MNGRSSAPILAISVSDGFEVPFSKGTLFRKRNVVVEAIGQRGAVHQLRFGDHALDGFCHHAGGVLRQFEGGGIGLCVLAWFGQDADRSIGLDQVFQIMGFTIDGDSQAALASPAPMSAARLARSRGRQKSG